MLKFLLLAAVVAVAFWMFKARGRKPSSPPGARKTKAPDAPGPAPGPTTQMLACAHCGVHLPQADTVADAAGRPYCTEAHRLAGPR